MRTTMVKARRIGHASFETPDLQRQTDYYTDLLGLTVADREKDRVFLATKIGQLAIELNRGERERCVRLSLRFRLNPISARSRENSARTASSASCATIPPPGSVRC
jgi:catechol 2,3-dioxygenase-like lactoylglutathione lyase family enzyme